MHRQTNNKDMDKALVLVRVSTFSQDLKQQTEAVLQAAKVYNYVVPDEYIIEDIESGVLLSEEERQGLNKMKACIERDPDIKTVFVYELSRLSRRVDVIFSIRDYLQKRKVQLIIIKPELKVFNDNWEVDVVAQMLFTFLAGWAEFEGYNRKIRLKRGKERLKAQGKKADGRNLIGFTVDKDKNIIPEPKEAEMIKLIFSLYLSKKHSYGSIVEELKRRGYKRRMGDFYGESQIGKIIKNPEYYKRGLITEEEFNKCKGLSKSRTNKPKKDYSGFVGLCKGLLVDAEPNKYGHKENFIVHKKSNIYWLKSKNKSIMVDFMDTFIWDFTKWIIRKDLEDPEQIINKKEELKEQIENLNKQIKVREDIIEENRKKIERCEERYIEGKWGKEKIEKLEKTYRINIENEQRELDKVKTRLNEVMEFYDSVEDSRKIKLSALNNITDPQEKLKLVRDTVESIDYEKGKNGETYVCVMLKKYGIGYYYKLVSGRGKTKKKIYRWGGGEPEELNEVDWNTY